MSKKLTLIVIMSLLFISSVGFAETPDYGNTWDTAEVITPDGTNYSATLDPSGDEDWFKFSQTGDNRYRFTLANTEGNWKTLTVYLRDEFDVMREIGHTSAWNEIKYYVPFFEKNYDCYVKVSGNAGTYTMSVEYLDTTPDDSYADECADIADEVVVGAGPVVGTLNHRGPGEPYDTDWFYFKTQPLHKYRIVKTQADNSATAVRVYNDDCITAISGDTYDFTLVSWYGDDYDLYVWGYDTTYGNYYTLEITDEGTYTDDHGNTCDDATAFVPDSGELAGTIDYSANYGNDEDWFTFTPKANTRYKFTIKNPEGNWKTIRVYQEGSLGTMVEQCYVSAWNQEQVLYAFFEYARPCCVNLYGAVGQYHLNIETLDTASDNYANDCASAVDEVPVDGGPIVGTLVHDTPYDTDWLYFPAQPLHKYHIVKTQANNSATAVRVYNDDCNAISGDTDNFTVIPWTTTEYELYVWGYNGDSYNNYYTLEVTDDATYTDDWPNTWATAASMPKDGTRVDFNLDYSANVGSDEDWFKFTAALSGTYHFTFANSVSGWKTLALYRFDELNHLVQVTYNNQWNNVVDFDVELTDIGDYYVAITGDLGAGYFSLTSPDPRCGDLDHPYPASDANKDCVVDLLDLKVLASEWLSDVRP